MSDKINPAQLKLARERAGVGIGLAMTAFSCSSIMEAEAMERDRRMWSNHALRIAAMLYRVPFEFFMLEFAPDFREPWCCEAAKDNGGGDKGLFYSDGRIWMNAPDDWVSGNEVVFCPFCGTRLVAVTVEGAENG